MKLTVNGEQKEVEGVRTVSDLLENMDIDPDRVAVEVNEDIVPGKKYQDFDLSPGSSVEIVTFVGGG